MSADINVIANINIHQLISSVSDRRAATISFAHPSVRVQMQQLLRQRQQQKAQQHQRQQTVVAASPQDNHAQLRQ